MDKIAAKKRNPRSHNIGGQSRKIQNAFRNGEPSSLIRAKGTGVKVWESVI